MFPSSSPTGAELSAVTAHLGEHGLAATRDRWSAHWRGALSEADLTWLSREARITTIRLPIGYFTLGPAFCKGTPFEPVAAVYEGAWQEVRELVHRARGSGIGVLLDLHALPGGANKDAHSGSGNGNAELWEQKDHRERAIAAAVFVAREARGMDGVVGVQVVNEACWGAKGLYEWYENVLRGIAEVDDQVPVYISDAWDLERCLKWVGQKRELGEGHRNPVVVDAHRYYTFTEKDHNQSPQEIIARIPGELGQLRGHEGGLVGRGAAQIVIGEWSCVMDGKTWARAPAEDKAALTKQFGHAQSHRWQEKAGGSYFWTMKMDWMDGGGWGFVAQTKQGNLPSPTSLALPFTDVKSRVQATQSQRAELSAAARQSHDAYWAKTSPGAKFEHHRYSEGWEVGFSDALEFFNMRVSGRLGDGVVEGGDRIGCLEIWVEKRLLESGQRGKFAWEWEQGMRAGVKAFQQSAGI